MSKILVTGATGKVGHQLVSTLVARGADVRAAVRNPDRARPRLPGAELAPFDYQDPAATAAALRGVERLFVIVPPELLDPAVVGRLVAAAREAGVSFIAKLSSMGSTADSEVFIGRMHAASDQIVRTSGADHALILPTGFMDNLLTFTLDAIRDQRAFYGASGDGKVSWVSSRDIAEVAAAVLLDPVAHRGAEYTLTGPEPLSAPEIAALVSEVAGATVRYVDVPPEVYRAQLVERGLPEPLADALTIMERYKASGRLAAVSPAVERVLGRPGERYRDFLGRHRALLA